MESKIDIVGSLIELNIHHVILQIYSYLDFPSLRKTLWVNQTWRRFTNENLSRMDFDKLERHHNVVKGSDTSLLLDSCHLSEPWKRLYKRVSKLTKGMQTLEDIWPLNLPAVPPKVSRADFLVNKKFILYAGKDKLVRQCRSTGVCSEIDPPDLEDFTSDTASTTTAMMHCDSLCLWQESSVAVYKMDEEARTFYLSHDLEFDQQDLDDGGLIGFSSAGGDQYLFHACHGRTSSVMHLLNVSRSTEESWQVLELDLPPVAQLRKVIFSDRYVAVSFTTGSGKMRCHLHVKTFCLESGKMLRNEILDDSLRSCYQWCARGKKLIVALPRQYFAEDGFECMALDATREGAQVKRIFIDLPTRHYDMRALDVCGEDHAIACLSRHHVTQSSARSHLAFVIWEIEKEVMLRTVLLDDLYFVGTIEEFWLLRRTAEDKSDGTTIMLCGFNRSLNAFKRLHGQSVQ